MMNKKTFAVVFLAAFISISFSTFTLAQTKTFTLDADFDMGSLLNINHDTPDELALNPAEDAEPFPFINVAASGRGTIVRINTETGEIIGEYWTAPNGRGRDPSRTTVDLDGNVWCGNRAEAFGNMGSVVKIGLIVGGTRVDADGSPNPVGQYLAPPYEYNTCVDRDSDGLIKTSIGLTDILLWTNAGGADDNGGVTTAEDEAITIYKRVNGTNVRHVSVDGDNNVWVGGYSNRAFDKLDGDTGDILISKVFSVGGYGGLVDGNGVLWSSSRNPNGLLRYDVATNTATNLGASSAYGLGIDSFGNIWHSQFTSNSIYKYDPLGAPLGSFVTGADSRGVAVTPADDNVWVANSGASSVSRLNNAGTTLAVIPVGSMPTGVAVDAEGKVWVTNYKSHNVMRINPATNAVDLTVSLGSGAYPYNYSDMTGIVVLAATASQGTWQIVYDTGVVGAEALEASWNASEPDGTSIVVEARAAATEAGLGSVPFATITNGGDPGLLDQFVEIKVTFNRIPEGENTPVLYDLTLEYNHPPDCSKAYADASCLWPPNHKYVPISILGVTDADGDDITITITSITSDEPTATDKGSGGAKHSPDAAGIGTNIALLRAERSGKGNGRVYEISFTADDGKGAQCQGSVMVVVPHDKSDDCTAIDDGQMYDATDIN